MEFAYNNNYQSSVGMAPYEALNEHKIVGPNLVKDIEEKVQIIQLTLLHFFFLISGDSQGCSTFARICLNSMQSTSVSNSEVFNILSQGPYVH